MVMLYFLSTHKYLGVMFDKKLSWDNHIGSVIKRARVKLFAINRLGPLSSNVKMLLYKALVLPVIDYCDIVWNPVKKTQINLIEQKIHRLAYCLIRPYNDSFSMTLSSRRNVHLLCQVFRCIYRISPSFLHDTFTWSPNNERSSKKRLLPPNVSTNYGKQSFYYSGACAWNLLNTELQTCVDFKHFKELCKEHFFLFDQI